MDDHNQRRRHNEPPYPTSDPRFMPDQSQGRGFSSSASQRFRPAPLQSPLGGRGDGNATAYSAYYQEPSSTFATAMPQSGVPYQSTYSQEPRQQQTFPGYNADVMYNETPQTPQSGVYESNQQFQAARQPAAMQMLPDVAAPYFSGEQSNAPGPPALQHHASSGSSVYQQHQQSPAERAPLLQQGYPASIGIGGMAPAASEVMETDEYQAPAQSQAQAQGQPPMEAAYNTYLTTLKEIFQNIVNGQLSEASRSLLDVSEWLLGHVTDLGLTVDEVTLHADRIRLWTEFNSAWLGIFQKQIDMLETRQRIQPPQSLMSTEYINKMAKDLIRMCDAVEKYGLVDYQYGVEEERILLILMECLDLQEALEDNDGAARPQSTNVGRAPP